MAVSAACMLTPRRLFLELGGFDEHRFAVAYNDPDYCYRLGDAGYRSVYCAEAELYHHEGASRGYADHPLEIAAYREVHGHRIDRYFSPHHDHDVETFEIKPTVVPVGYRGGPIPFLAVTHNLNWEGAPWIEFELVRRLQASGVIRAEVLSPSEGPLRRAYEDEGITIRVEPELEDLAGPLSSRKLYDDSTARLAEWIGERGFEVVHANTLRTFWAIEAARLARVPSIWSVHESEPWQTSFNDLPRGLIASALSCLASPYRVVFSARSSIQAWEALNTSHNFELIRFAHDVPQLLRRMGRMHRSLARRELGLEAGEVCVLLMGTVCQRKGQLDLLKAFAALPGPIAARMRCFVVGARDKLAYSRELDERARRLPPDRRERFVVVPETGETAAYWQAADLFCCTSRLESYPLVILEAMAAGLPIITTPVFGIAEQVRPSINALFYQPGDIATLAGHLTSLTNDEALRHALAEASPQVLRSLPDDARMNELYRRTILAAAESSPLLPATPGTAASRRGRRALGREWFPDSGRQLGSIPSAPRMVIPAAK
jgi:glycosyltransferase involved in cell wall biosynthesis